MVPPEAGFCHEDCQKSTPLPQRPSIGADAESCGWNRVTSRSAVRYIVNAEPALVGVCHCRDCQKFTGSAFSFLVAVPEDALEIQGVSKTFAKPGDSGGPIVRRFCPECGSSIAEEAAIRPGLVLLNGGTLDAPTSVTPTMQIYCDRELPWARLDGSLQRFAAAAV